MVKQSLFDICIKDFEPSKEIYKTNEPVVKHIDITWSLGLLDMIEYSLKN